MSNRIVQKKARMLNRPFDEARPAPTHRRERQLVGMRRGRQNPDGSITDLGPANGGATRRFGNNNSIRPFGGNIVCSGWAYGVPPHGPYPPKPVY